MSYYSRNANEYIDKTLNLDMSKQYDLFEKHLKPNALILDVGFGSGRDMLYFKNCGYNVYGIDLEEKFVEHALSLDLNVEHADVLTYKSSQKFDGIWCCASLLHLKLNDIKNAINHLKTLLKKDGIIYLSFKYGSFNGYIEDRYFTYMDDEKIDYLNLDIIDKLLTNDSSNRDVKWLNLIIK